MTTKQIIYRDGYKNQLLEDFQYPTGIKIKDAVKSNFLFLSMEGLLTVLSGYAWDGPSGPTLDTKDFMRGSLVHDALYQLMREKKISKLCRPIADDLLYQICREDGMWAFRAAYVRWGVKRWAAKAADYHYLKPPKTAP